MPMSVCSCSWMAPRDCATARGGSVARFKVRGISPAASRMGKALKRSDCGRVLLALDRHQALGEPHPLLFADLRIFEHARELASIEQVPVRHGLLRPHLAASLEDGND